MVADIKIKSDVPTVNQSIKNFVFTIIPKAEVEREKAVAKLLENCESVLDVGCGRGSALHFFTGRKDGVEIYHPYVEEVLQSGHYGHVFELDARDFSSVPDKSYDAAVCFHVVEHMSKREGLFLLREMERIARRTVVVETPNGYMTQEGYDDNEFQKHRSGWDPHEFESLGYHVAGLFGYKHFQKHRFLKHLTSRILSSRPASCHVLLASKCLGGVQDRS
jgi:SAM-dependent methyltransferase